MRAGQAMHLLEAMSSAEKECVCVCVLERERERDRVQLVELLNKHNLLVRNPKPQTLNPKP